MTEPVRVTCAVPAFNAGETTRGTEVAEAICEIGLQRRHVAEITFLYPRTTLGFEAQIRQAGFQARAVDFSLTEGEIAAIMHADHIGEEFVRDLATARRFIEICTTELEKNRPDLLVGRAVAQIPHEWKRSPSSSALCQAASSLGSSQTGPTWISVVSTHVPSSRRRRWQ